MSRNISEELWQQLSEYLCVPEELEDNMCDVAVYEYSEHVSVPFHFAVILSCPYFFTLSLCVTLTTLTTPTLPHQHPLCPTSRLQMKLDSKNNDDDIHAGFEIRECHPFCVALIDSMWSNSFCLSTSSINLTSSDLSLGE